jgi:F420H(2)-dependent quinone reductase
MAVNPGAQRRRARVMRAVNVPMRTVLGLPFRTPLSGNLMLISYTGRKTGKAYRQPVSYARDGDVLLTPGGGRWTLNLGDGRPVRIRLRGRDVRARPELVRDPEEVERLLGVIASENPRAARL